MKLDRGDFVLLEWWMLEDLGLKGNELLVYALIHNFSKKKDQRFFGSIEYIMKWTNASKRTVYYTINSLLEKGLIIKDEEEYHNQEFAYYRANLDLLNKGAAGGEEEKKEADPPVKQERAKKKEKEEQEREKLFSEFADQFSFVEHTREDLISALNDFVAVRNSGKDPMKPQAITRHMNRLVKFVGSDGDKAVETIDLSIRRGWTDIYELKDYDKGRKQPESRPAPSPAEGADLIAKLAEYGYKWNDKHGEPNLKTIKHLIEGDDLDREYYYSIGDLIKI